MTHSCSDRNIYSLLVGLYEGHSLYTVRLPVPRLTVSQTGMHFT